jgi:hypothetical protein
VEEGVLDIATVIPSLFVTGRAILPQAPDYKKYAAGPVFSTKDGVPASG